MHMQCNYHFTRKSGWLVILPNRDLACGKVRQLAWWTLFSRGLGPIPKRVYELKSCINMKKSQMKNDEKIRPQFCKWLDSWAVMPCANLWPDHTIKMKITGKTILTRFELCDHKPFTKRVAWFSKVFDWPSHFLDSLRKRGLHYVGPRGQTGQLPSHKVGCPSSLPKGINELLMEIIHFLAN